MKEIINIFLSTSIISKIFVRKLIKQFAYYFFYIKRDYEEYNIMVICMFPIQAGTVVYFLDCQRSPTYQERACRAFILIFALPLFFEQCLPRRYLGSVAAV